MNAIEIKEKRLLLGISQKELAKRIGVSTQTINGYENGKEIPTTKYQILDTILNQNISNIINEPGLIYEKITKKPNEQLIQAFEKLQETERIIELLKKNRQEENLSHYEQMQRLLKTQIDLINKSEKQILKEEEILKKLDIEEK